MSSVSKAAPSTPKRSQKQVVKQTQEQTLSFPPRYDGQGPEHSSARLERYLQMSDDNPNVIPEMDPSLRRQLQQVNWQVCNVTTPANYFHVLRRQVSTRLGVWRLGSLFWGGSCIFVRKRVRKFVEGSRGRFAVLLLQPD